MSYNVIYHGEAMTPETFMDRYELNDLAQYEALEAMCEDEEVMAQVNHDLWPAPSAGTMLAYWLDIAGRDLVID